LPRSFPDRRHSADRCRGLIGLGALILRGTDLRRLLALLSQCQGSVQACETVVMSAGRFETREPARVASCCACLIVVLVVFGALPASAMRAETPVPAPRVSPVVIVYGDSIVHGAGPFLRTMLAQNGVTLVDTSVGGTSPCDSLPFVNSDMQRFDPTLVVIAFVGNSFSPCINGTPNQYVLWRHYVDTQKLVAAVSPRPVLLDTPPGSIGEGRYTAYDVLVHIEASTFGTGIADTAKALLDPVTHRFENSMPCATGSVCQRIDVRGPDGYHLSPAGGYLYAQALSSAIMRRLERPSGA